MAKWVGKLPKEKGMGASEATEMSEMIWEIIPRRRIDTARSYFGYAATKLRKVEEALFGDVRAWNARRVRAYFHDEVRTPTAREWRTLYELKIHLEGSAQDRRGRLNDIAIDIAQRDAAGKG